MSVLLTFICCLSIVGNVFPMVYISNDDIKVAFKMDNRCISNSHRFAFWQKLSFAECIKECGFRKHCLGLNYRRHAHVCELFSSSVADELVKGNCIFVAASDITLVQVFYLFFFVLIF